MTRLSKSMLSAVVLGVGTAALASNQGHSAVRIRRIVDPARGPQSGATLLIPPGVDDVAIATPGGAKPSARVTVRDHQLGGISAATPDWRNSGGNSERNGLSSQAGPAQDVLLWSGGPASIIGWQAFTEGGRMFVVRQNGYPPQDDRDSVIYALDLETGAQIWLRKLPFKKGQWTTWIAGVNNGVVYASRSGLRPDAGARLFALDAGTGKTLWISRDDITASVYDGVVFAPDGDLIVGSFTSIMRIEAADGSTVWRSSRLCSVTSSCGAALFGGAVYLADLTVGGQEIVRHDLATGTRMYASPVMPGLTVQNTPMVGPDGTIYMSRTQSDPTTDFFYAFQDTGTALEEKWHVPAAWTTFSEFAVASDSSVYMIAPSYEIHRLDPGTGATLDTSAPIPFDIVLRTRMATDAAGRLFLSNGGFANGRLFAFDANLTPLWDAPVTNINIGGPSLGAGGRLAVCGIDNDIRVFSDQNASPSRK